MYLLRDFSATGFSLLINGYKYRCGLKIAQHGSEHQKSLFGENIEILQAVIENSMFFKYFCETVFEF